MDPLSQFPVGPDTLFDTEVRARTTDPYTSHLAAGTVNGLRAKQAAVQHVLYEHGPLSLAQLVRVYRENLDLPDQSESGIRTRAHELLEKGLVVVTGERINEGGRRERLLDVIL